MTETYGLLILRTPQFRNMPTRPGTFLFGMRLRLLTDPHWYTQKVKEAMTLHPNNINRDGGTEILHAWMPTIKNIGNKLPIFLR